MLPARLRCIRCGTTFPATEHTNACRSCAPQVAAALTLDANHELSGVSKDSLATGVNSMWRYEHTLPVARAHAITLGEGMTPLIPLHHLGAGFGLPELYAKCEFANPTGSFKDRLASSAISSARHLFDARVIATSSTGNAGAAAAAYAAKAGIDCIIFTTASASGPIVAQMQAYGATVVATPTKADRWRLLKQGVEQFNWFPTSPFFAPPIGSNPFGVEGYKTLAYEIAQDFGWSSPDWIVLPVCYGDALYGMWNGFRELLDMGWIDRIPRFVAAEIYGSLSAAYATGDDTLPIMKQPYETAATSITSPQGTYQSLTVLRSSDGLPIRVQEDELRWARRLISRKEGLYVETAAAATIAATQRLAEDNIIGHDQKVVCLLTAGGLKEMPIDPDENPVIQVPADLEEMIKLIREQTGRSLSK